MTVQKVFLTESELKGSNFQSLYASIMHSIKTIKSAAEKALNQSTQRTASVFPEYLSRNNFAILGSRGSGKTTLLISILKELEASEENIVLPEIDPDRFEIDENPLGWIIFSFQDIIDKEKAKERKEFDLCFNNSEHDCFDKYEKLKECYLKSQIFYKESSEKFMGGPEDHLALKQEMNNADLSVEKLLGEFINSYVRYKKDKIKGENKTPTILIFFDDADLSDTHCLKILKVIKDYLHNPSIITFVCGDHDIFREALILSMLQKTHYSDKLVDYSDKLYEMTPRKPTLQNIKTLADELMNKIFPLAYQFKIQPYSWADRIKYHPVTISNEVEENLGDLLNRSKIIWNDEKGKAFSLKDYFRTPTLNLNKLLEDYENEIVNKTKADFLLQEYKAMIDEKVEQQKKENKPETDEKNAQWSIPVIDILPHTPRGLTNIYNILNKYLENNGKKQVEENNILDFETFYNPLFYRFYRINEDGKNLTKALQNNYLILVTLYKHFKSQSDILRGVAYIDKESENYKGEDPYIFIEYVFNEIFTFYTNIQNIYLDFTKIRAKNKLSKKYQKYFVLDSQLDFTFQIQSKIQGSKRLEITETSYLLESTQSMFVQFIHDLATICLPTSHFGKKNNFINTEDIYIYDDENIRIELTYFKFYYDFYVFQRLYEIYIPIIENSKNPKKRLREAIYNIVKGFYSWEEKGFEELEIKRHRIREEHIKGSGDEKIIVQEVPSEEILKHIDIKNIIIELKDIIAEPFDKGLTSVNEKKEQIKNTAKKLDEIRERSLVVLSVTDERYGGQIFKHNNIEGILESVKIRNEKIKEYLGEQLKAIQSRKQLLDTLEQLFEDANKDLHSLLEKEDGEFESKLKAIRLVFNWRLYVIRLVFMKLHKDTINGRIDRIVSVYKDPGNDSGSKGIEADKNISVTIQLETVCDDGNWKKIYKKIFEKDEEQSKEFNLRISKLEGFETEEKQLISKFDVDNEIIKDIKVIEDSEETPHTDIPKGGGQALKNCILKIRQTIETPISQSYYKLLLITYLRLEKRFGEGQYIRDIEDIIKDNRKNYNSETPIDEIKVRCNMFEYTVYGYEKICGLKEEIAKSF